MWKQSVHLQLVSYLTGTLIHLRIIIFLSMSLFCSVLFFMVEIVVVCLFRLLLFVEIFIICFFSCLFVVIHFCFSSRSPPRSCPSSSDISLTIFQFTAVAKSTLIYRSIWLLRAVLSPSPSWLPPPPHLFMHVLNHLSVELLRAGALCVLHQHRLMAPEL